MKTIEMTTDEFHATHNEDGGFCLACGEPAYGIEPDARRYECESCGERQVYGVDELLVMGWIDITA